MSQMSLGTRLSIAVRNDVQNHITQLYYTHLYRQGASKLRGIKETGIKVRI